MALIPFGRVLRRHVDADPDRPLITCEGRTVTRAEFDRRTNRLARAYAEFGVGQDALVTIALPNGIEFYEAAVACWKLGATPQPVSWALPRAEFQAIVDLAEPALMVGGDAEVARGRPHVEQGFEPPAYCGSETLPEDRIARCWKAPTSGGSTGRPKLILASQPAAFDPDAPFMQMRLDQTQLVPGPLYHNAPFSLSMIGLTRGHHLVVMTRFDAAQALTLMQRHRVNWLVLVPTMMQRIWRLGPSMRLAADLSALDTLWHMAAPCPAWLKREWIDWVGAEKVWELYGGTEGQGSTTIRGDEWLRHPGSVGRPLENCIIKVLDEQGREAHAGQVGEIYMKPRDGTGTTYRYVGASAKAGPEGLESLGDMGWFDPDGYLYIADRLPDMILVGGANVYPAEVEAAIDAHPSVRSSAVIGLPDEDLGHRVHAIVDVSVPTSSEELLEFVASRLARYKLPRSVEFVDFPLRDDAGKVRRTELRRRRLATRAAEDGGPG